MDVVGGAGLIEARDRVLGALAEAVQLHGASQGPVLGPECAVVAVRGLLVEARVAPISLRAFQNRKNLTARDPGYDLLKISPEARMKSSYGKDPSGRYLRFPITFPQEQLEFKGAAACQNTASSISPTKVKLAPTSAAAV